MAFGYWSLFSFHVNELGVDKLGELTLPENLEERKSRLVALRHSLGADEVFYLGTCNRVEFLFHSETSMNESALPWYNYKHRRFNALEEILSHLLKVSVGRDSVVIGENQILGQFKRAYQEACEMDLLGSTLNTTLNIIVRETKALRTKVKITNFPNSISTVAGKFLVDELSNVNAPILLVGFSETHQILAKYLRKWKYSQIYWTNRTDSRLNEENNDLIDEVIPWSDFVSGNIPKLSAISVATRSDTYVVTEEIMVEGQPSIVLDLSVPANADKSLVEKHDAKYIGISEISERLSKKKKEAQAQIEIIDDFIDIRTQSLVGELAVRFSDNFLKGIVAKTEDLIEQAVSQGRSLHFDELDAKVRESIEKWSRNLAKKVAHEHLQAIKTILPHSDQK